MVYGLLENGTTLSLGIRKLSKVNVVPLGKKQWKKLCVCAKPEIPSVTASKISSMFSLVAIRSRTKLQKQILELPELCDKLASVQKSLSARERALGVEGKKRYNHLASSQFITDLMNACTLKLRLRQRLQSPSEWKLHNHTKSSVKRRDPGIQSVAQQFNQLQVCMAAAVKGRGAPSNAVVP
ncbi:hypothetical protein BDP27DRAFT_1366888 [Rhodocollybia butyracea]|uniref:Uncharacterized protein n=1 Tax=Rhodocollybia butyracea TaxID=206335 RepID=A0A9P5U3E2_9AGAR|nr:hypothetical protein BDP27DRAFT_1366888 [Rhodocollybia butyracea]